MFSVDIHYYTVKAERIEIKTVKLTNRKWCVLFLLDLLFTLQFQTQIEYILRATTMQIVYTLVAFHFTGLQ
jgi:hypothetical protein